MVTRHTERAEQDNFYDTLVKKGKKIYYYLRPHKYVVAKLLTHSRLLLIYLYVCLFIYLFIHLYVYLFSLLSYLFIDTLVYFWCYTLHKSDPEIWPVYHQPSLP